VYDDRYAFPGLFPVYCCEQCRHMFIQEPSGPLCEQRLYTDYYPRAAFDLENFHPKSFPGGIRSWLNGDNGAACRWVPPGVKILDIGCGFGETLAYHQQQGCEAYGVELDENVRKAADRFHLEIHVGEFDPGAYPPGSFDYVTLQQVLEHVRDPLETMKGVARVLRSGGCAVISTPNAGGWGARLFGRRWINWHVPYHRHFFSPESIAVVAREAGFRVDTVRTVTSSEWLRYQWVHLMSVPREGVPSAFWSPRGKRTLPIKVGQQLLDVLHYTRINHLLTRLFDSLGMGDNFMLILKKP